MFYSTFYLKLSMPFINSASGLQFLIKIIIHNTAGPIPAIINMSIQEGYMPELWRSATTVPVSKKPQPNDITNGLLRPLSHTPVLSKVNEKMGGKWIWEYIGHWFDPTQYGAIKNSSLHMRSLT